VTHKCESVPKILKKWRSKKGGKATIEKYKLALSIRWLNVVVDSTPQTCGKCLKVFTNDDEFACHGYSVCAEDPKFICSDCGKEFSNMQGLKSHADVHVENRRFICESCGIAFAVKVIHTRQKLPRFKSIALFPGFTDQTHAHSHNWSNVQMHPLSCLVC
jgi:transposase-like protein